MASEEEWFDGLACVSLRILVNVSAYLVGWRGDGALTSSEDLAISLREGVVACDK